MTIFTILYIMIKIVFILTLYVAAEVNYDLRRYRQQEKLPRTLHRNEEIDQHDEAEHKG